MPAARASAAGRWLMVAIIGIALVFHLWGIQRDFPYATDDPVFVNAAVLIAGSGNLNPYWFGHPGSTVIYPLAFAYRVWNASRYGASLLFPDPNLKATLRNNAAEFHFMGRLLTVLYALIGVLLVYQIGRSAFDEPVAVAGAWLSALYPTVLFDKVVRTDGACLCFGLLALWLCLRLFERPTLRNQLLAGGAIGLAISTKYYLGTLVAVLGVIDAVLLWRALSLGSLSRATVLGCAAGMAAVALGFAVSTPYFFLDHTRAMHSLNVELRTAHVGAEGLSPLGNFRWYMWFVLPTLVSSYQAVPAAVGLGRALWVRRPQQLLLLVFALAFLCGISAHSLHWERWLLPLLPVVALFAASGLDLTVEALATRVHVSRAVRAALFACAALAVAIQPVTKVAQINRKHANVSTGAEARQWMEGHLPRGSRVVFEWATIPMPLKADLVTRGVYRNRTSDVNFIEMAMASLSGYASLEEYKRMGYRYLVTAAEWYEYYPANADRFPKEAAFYRELLTRGRLLYEVSPAPLREGDAIRIYEIP